MGLIRQMKEQENMTERERDICNYILEHPEQVESISSRELGHVTFTSAASVTRLCQKLGMKGFPEFKIQFIREVQNGQMEEKQEKVTMSERENVVTIVRKATCVQLQAIEETKKELSYSQLVRIGKWIAEATCVDFYVYDMNVYLAEYGRSQFFHAGKVANVLSATNIQGLQAAMPAEGHIAILISHTGENERLVEIAKMLKRNKTKIIVMTAKRNGSIASFADELLYAAAQKKVEELWNSMFFASGKYLLDILYGMEFSRKYEENLRLNKKYEQSGEKILWGIKEATESIRNEQNKN
ncbi:MAG: MurR/RpiR family transcriptional regulator [Lachnospiraceae bacterium]|jgi:RpiR family carbohydrate utilization transcriptional regulator|nr:MurR/RpiR family transcriptional regulator [Lachnospiraceae bacterium]